MTLENAVTSLSSEKDSLLAPHAELAPQPIVVTKEHYRQFKNWQEIEKKQNTLRTMLDNPRWNVALHDSLVLITLFAFGIVCDVSWRRANYIPTPFMLFAETQDNYLFELNQKSGHWGKAAMPISVFIKKGSAGIKDYHDDYPEIFKESMAEWCDASQGKVSVMYVDDPGRAKILCSWTDNEDGSLLPNDAGVTSFAEIGNSMRVEIILNTHIPRPSKSMDSLKNYMAGTCLHEIGHALGFNGHSSQSNDVMYSNRTFYDGSPIHLSERDKKTIRMFYSTNLRPRTLKSSQAEIRQVQ